MYVIKYLSHDEIVSIVQSVPSRISHLEEHVPGCAAMDIFVALHFSREMKSTQNCAIWTCKFRPHLMLDII